MSAPLRIGLIGTGRIGPVHAASIAAFSGTTLTWIAELEAFAERVRGGESRSPGFEDGRAALVLADAAERSAASGVSVTVDLTL